MNENAIHIRAYREKDQPALVALLKLNTPTYFSVEEERDLITYLETEREDYFVVELAHKIVGCGGINTKGTTGILSWAFIHPEYQRKGIGNQLIAYRIKHLLQQKKSSKIIVRTIQLVYPFFEKNGFKVMQVEKDYWSKGFDLYLMEYQNKA
ncbi:GNAT family N-acetyltransferase [Mesonia ostreae]|uniref:GNAT family N-acetyltransferase n=1 Tax=Mesonia ostreae TaxID=861110 RepID=A0ABU2KJ80_9FLAO|nr:GNAT family N-acetyltransferase [Mesonia ostreae]MDT0294775.1 GNAT family N-acetyltransferase [Mesonia ostreae]